MKNFQQTPKTAKNTKQIRRDIVKNKRKLTIIKTSQNKEHVASHNSLNLCISRFPSYNDTPYFSWWY